MKEATPIKEKIELNTSGNGASPAVPIPADIAQSTPYLSGEFALSPAFAPLGAHQEQARMILPGLVFPGNKDEAWRKTSLRELPLEKLRLAGHTSLTLSLAPEGVIFCPLAQAFIEHENLLAGRLNRLVPVERDKFSALAAGYAQNGFFLYVPRGVILEDDLYARVNLREDGSIQNSQVLIVLEEGAEATLHLAFGGKAGNQPALHSGIVEVFVGDRARFHLVETQDLPRQSWHFSHEKASLGAEAQLDWVYFAFGSKLSKSFVEVELAGRGGAARLDGISITNSGQHLDLDTQQDHLAPMTTSNLNFKTALLGKSRSVWQGMIYVDPAATRTDGYQSSRNLLLDQRAHADAIPGLEIKTDDVRCTHGATISHVDQEMIFYLRSRGIDEAAARDLIVNGFFEEIVDKARDKKARHALRGRISEKLKEDLG